MNVESFLDTKMTDKQFDLKLDWESKGKPTSHPFIYMLLEEYAKLVNDANTNEEKALPIPHVSNLIIAFLKWRKGEQLTHETILEVETFAKEYKSNL